MTPDESNTQNSEDAIVLSMDEFFMAFELLPSRVRRAMIDANLNWNPIEALERLDDLYQDMPRPDAVAAYVYELRCCDVGELHNFAEKWRRRMGTIYPHLAAEATFIRYHSAKRRRRRVFR
jgi:hypothetical protein